MKFYYLIVFSLFSSITSFAQVGIGTTNPSPASMLEVSSKLNDNNYVGLMPPRVTLEQRDLINAKENDVGLLVFVNDPAKNKQCLQIWNGLAWQDIHCLNDLSFSNIVQNFDAGSSWSYSSDVDFFDDGNSGFYGITDNSGNFSDIQSLTNNFLGVNDLDDEREGVGADDFATITFATVDVSSAPAGVTVQFSYDFFEFDNGDDCYYTLVIDGMDQAEVQLIEGETNKSLSGTIERIIDPGTSTVGLHIRIKQNGVDDYAGFDNFVISAN